VQGEKTRKGKHFRENLITVHGEELEAFYLEEGRSRKKGKTKSSERESLKRSSPTKEALYNETRRKTAPAPRDGPRARKGKIVSTKKENLRGEPPTLIAGGRGRGDEHFLGSRKGVGFTRKKNR